MIELLVSMATAMWISTAEPKLSADKTFDYAEHIARESLRWGLNPKLVVAIIWHESNFRNLGNNSTNDRGLMQVHWSPGAPWLKGLKKDDLLNYKINIRAGVHELAWWKNTHETRCKNQDSHHWWAHYKWGYKVKNRKYGKAIMKKRSILRGSVSSVKVEEKSRYVAR